MFSKSRYIHRFIPKARQKSPRFRLLYGGAFATVAGLFGFNNTNHKINHDNNKSHHLIFHITGYGPFANIRDNPSQKVIQNLQKNEFLQNAINNESDIIGNSVTIGSLYIMTASAKQGKQELLQLRQKNDKLITNKDDQATTTTTIYLHYGVFAERPYFCLENTAYNECDFPAPDELGWQPVKEKIIKNEDLNHKLYNQLDVKQIIKKLNKINKYNVRISNDPGRFMCNWIFYWSLYFIKQNKKNNEYAMFVHVPSFDNADEELQAEFAKDLVIAIAKTQLNL